METIKILNATAIPVNQSVSVQEDLSNTVQEVNQVIDSIDDTTQKEKEAKDYLNILRQYIKGDSFKKDVEEVSKKTGVPPKKVAQNFFEKALGTVGDILGIAISVVCNAGRMVVNLASTVCHSIVNLIQNILNGVASIVTLNKTCTA